MISRIHPVNLKSSFFAEWCWMSLDQVSEDSTHHCHWHWEFSHTWANSFAKIKQHEAASASSLHVDLCRVMSMCYVTMLDNVGIQELSIQPLYDPNAKKDSNEFNARIFTDLDWSSLHPTKMASHAGGACFTAWWRAVSPCESHSLPQIPTQSPLRHMFLSVQCRSCRASKSDLASCSIWFQKITVNTWKAKQPNKCAEKHTNNNSSSIDYQF